MSSAQPTKTLYINNLNDKVKKPELRSQLYHLFSAFGRVVDVVATKTSRMRGQAFVAFGDQVAATTAMRSLGGETFYGKPLNITYAKTVSKALLPTSQSTAPPGSFKVVTSTAQREADDLKRSREEEDTIRESKKFKADNEMVDGGSALANGNTDGPGAASEDEDDMDMDDDDDDGEAAPGPNPS